jgi:peroxiredoxin
MPPLQVGDAAPDFELPDHQGSRVKLSDFRGKRNVVLAFYVLANTPTWTGELKAYQSGLALFEKAKTQVLGISINTEATNHRFAQKLGLTFPLLCDAKKNVSKLYGVLSFFRVAKRVTFVVNKQGTIRHIDRGAAAADPGGALEAASALG